MKLLKQASEGLRRANARLAAIHKKEKEAEAETWGNVSAGIACAGSAVLDKKLGENGEPYKIKGIPVNAVIGGAAVGLAMFMPKLPYRKHIGMAGLGAGLPQLYRAVYDAVDVSQ